MINVQGRVALLVGIADTLMVSHVSEAAVSGVSLVNQLNNVFIMVFNALASGGAVVVSQYIGCRDRIRAVENGTLNYYSAVHQRMEANVHGSQASLIGQSKVNAAVFGGGKHTWRLQLELKLEQKAGIWKGTAARASTY